MEANAAGAADVAVGNMEEGLSGGETQILTNAEHDLKESSTHRAPPESVAPNVAPAVVQGAFVKMGTPQAAQKVVDAFPLVSGDNEAAFVQGAVVEMGTPQQPLRAAKETIDAFPLVSGDDEAAFVQGAVVKQAMSPNGPDKCANDLPKSLAVEESTLQLMHQQFSSLKEELTKQLHQNQELQKRVDSLEYQVYTCGHTCVLTDEAGRPCSQQRVHTSPRARGLLRRLAGLAQTTRV